MATLYKNEQAEREADDIGLRFAHSQDVMRDMSNAYDADFSNVRIHTDSSADSIARAVNRDAVARGNDLYFASGIYGSGEPAANALVGHELAHVMQQTGQGDMGSYVEMGAEQGGILDWFREKLGFSTDKKVGKRDKSESADRYFSDKNKGKLSAVLRRYKGKTGGNDIAGEIDAEEEKKLTGSKKDLMEKIMDKNSKYYDRLLKNHYRVTGDAIDALKEPMFRSLGYLSYTKGFDNMDDKSLDDMIENLVADESDSPGMSRDRNLAGLRTFKDAMMVHYDYLEDKYGYEPPTGSYVIDNFEQITKDASPILQFTYNMQHYKPLFPDYESENDPGFIMEERFKAQITFYGVFMGSLKTVDVNILSGNFGDFDSPEEAAEFRKDEFEKQLGGADPKVAEAREYLKSHPRT